MRSQKKVENFDLGYLYQGDTLHGIDLTVESQNVELLSICAEWRNNDYNFVHECVTTVNNGSANIQAISGSETIDFPPGDIYLGVKGVFDNNHTHTLFTARLVVLKSVARC